MTLNLRKFILRNSNRSQVQRFRVQRFIPAFGGAAGDQGSTNKDNVESHQWRETCERMKKITLNL